VVQVGGCQFLTDDSDKKALRGRCHVPEYAEAIEYQGFPSMVGFGQREGLEVSGRFNLPSDHVETFEAFAKAEGWESLPIPPEIRPKILFRGMKVNLDAKVGRFRCRTAGDNVLYSTVSRLCRDVDNLSDIMISVYEKDKAEITAVVRSGY
jgi:hypothetical protein